jgi:electron transfer flavoprotein beta subunit
LKIVVCVKLVPDSAAKLSAQDGRPDWGDAPLVINPWDEYAVEAALLLQEAHGGEVIALSIGGEEAKEALKHALAMGCSQAVLVNDPGLAQADSLATARTIKSAIEKIAEVDLAVFGRQAIDTDTGITSVQTARCLGWPSLSLVSSILTFDSAQALIEVERSTEEGRQKVSGRLPSVISVVKDIAEPRYPSFMGIRKASRAEIPVWTLADLGMVAPQKRVSWPEVVEPPRREVTTEMITGSNPQEIAEGLVDKILAEGVL